MLLRVIIAVEDSSLSARIKRLINQEDIFVERLKGECLTWSEIISRNGDVLIISRSLIPEPARDAVVQLRQIQDKPGLVVLSKQEDSNERAEFLSAGCDAVLHESLSEDKLGDVLSTILMKRLLLEERFLQVPTCAKGESLNDFQSQSPVMQNFLKTVHRVVNGDVTLLIQGETGVGKERLAKAIHNNSLRSEGPFIAVNCGAIPETLLESELFGHESGAFTGASHSRRGWFELAHRGTIFLDEIGEMPCHLQVKILRVLQEHEIQRLGSEKIIQVNVRVITATNKDLAAEVEAHRFRKDLYYRLGVVTLTVPPLRDRPEDIPSLVNNYIEQFRAKFSSPVTGISKEAVEALVRYSWPGNVRELINVVERAVLLSNGKQITFDDLPEAIRGKENQGLTPSLLRKGEVHQCGMKQNDYISKTWREVKREFLERLEKAYLTGLLEQAKGKVGVAALRAGIRPRSLYDKMKYYGLRKEDFRRNCFSADNPVEAPLDRILPTGTNGLPVEKRV